MGTSDDARISRQASDSAHSRHLQIQEDGVRRLLAQFLQGLLAAARIVYRKALRHQRGPQNTAGLGFVVHNQDSRDAHAVVRIAAGKEKWNTAPPSGRLVTQISPPCASTKHLALARPSPVPGMLELWREPR